MKLAISLHEITSSDRFWNEVVYRLPFWPAGEIVHPLTAAQLKGGLNWNFRITGP